MKKHLNTFIKAILAGLSIGLGGCLYLLCKSVNQPLIGSALFSAGLILVLCFRLNLYTGKIGYVLRKDKSYLRDLLLIYLGNFVGAVILGLLFRVTNQLLCDSTGFLVSCSKLIKYQETGKTFFSLFFGGAICGALVYTAVEAYKSETISNGFKIVLIILCVFSFVSLGFEHCIADIFYFASAGSNLYAQWWRPILTILIITLGNSIGSILLDLLLHAFEGDK